MTLSLFMACKKFRQDREQFFVEPSSESLKYSFVSVSIAVVRILLSFSALNHAKLSKSIHFPSPSYRIDHDNNSYADHLNDALYYHLRHHCLIRHHELYIIIVNYINKSQKIEFINQLTITIQL